MMPQDIVPPANQPLQEPERPLEQTHVLESSESEVKVVGSKDPKKEGWRSVISTVAILIAAPLVALLLINFVFQSYEVDGPSMESTLQNHDRLIVDKIPRTIARLRGRNYIPARGDIIIFTTKGLSNNYDISNKQLIKRVIGLPGDRVVVTDNHITVYNAEHPNGYNPDTSPRYGSAIHNTSGTVDTTVGPDEVYVCGDNRENSLDSRILGAIPARDIVGKLAFRIYPIAKAQSF